MKLDKHSRIVRENNRKLRIALLSLEEFVLEHSEQFILRFVSDDIGVCEIVELYFGENMSVCVIKDVNDAERLVRVFTRDVMRWSEMGDE